MLVPLSWLKEYVDITLSPEELADRFDLTGTAIESVRYLGEGLDKVVVGRVVECAKHAEADRLSVCQVDVGEGGLRQIICGAPNVAAGQLVPVALPGASLPNGVEITKAKLRGVESNGMICSEAELKIGVDRSGIMVLEGEYEVGEPVAEQLGLDDVVFELEITPNRPDCLSMIGVAREIAAITGAELRIPGVKVEEAGEPIEGAATVEIKDPDLCPRYEARVIKGIKLGPSPLWMRQRLEKAGVRPISNIVDVTNYVMLETGQPLHAFDYDKLEGHAIVVRRAQASERMVTLDDVERLLSEEDLLIADAGRAVAIAGVMGGKYSEVDDSTKNILLESAHFLPESVMRTSRRLGLLSEASVRFEKGVDPNGVAFAADRAIDLMRELASGTVLKGAVDAYPRRIEPGSVKLRNSRVNSMLGTDLGVKEVASYLEALGLRVEEGDDELTVTVPTFRFDLEREIDLIEEVARLYGFNEIESTLPAGGWRGGGLSVEQRVAMEIKGRLVAQGLYEAQTYSFIDPREAAMMNLPEGHRLLEAIALLNPLSEEQSVMRTSILPGLLKAVRHNLYREQPTVALFEVGRVYAPSRDKLPEERTALAIALAGVVHENRWYGKARPFDFFDLKGMIDDLLAGVGVGDWSISKSEDRRFHPGHAADLYIGGIFAGTYGEIHPAVVENFDLPAVTVVAEISQDVIVKAASFERYFEEIPKFPAIALDVALIVDDEVSHEALTGAILAEGEEMLESVRIFDIFTGGSMPPGKKSVAYSMTYRSPERTLTDEEAKAAQSRIIARLEREFGAEVRK